MKTEQLKIVTLNIDELTPNERNAKLHPREQIEQIKESIKENGFNDPVAVWGDKNIVVEGHGRLIACKELGFTTIDCIRLDHLTDEQRRAYTLTHNKLTMNSGFDDELLELETEELAELGVDIIGFDFDETSYGEEIPTNFIDTLLQDEHAMGKQGANDLERDTFNITFTFPKEYEEAAKEYLSNYGKDKIVEIILQEMGAM